MKTIIFVLLPFLAFSQESTSSAVSDSIELALVGHVNDSILSPDEVTIKSMEAFYFSDGYIYVCLAQMTGGSFRAVTNSGNPAVIKYSASVSDCTRTWSIFELVDWLNGNIGTNYEGVSFSGSGTITAELTVHGTVHTGTGSNNVNAFGDAFYRFLIHPDFLTYLIN